MQDLTFTFENSLTDTSNIKFRMRQLLFLVMIGIAASLNVSAQTAVEIIEKAEENFRASDNIMEIKMTIVRPNWTREMVMKSWNIGEDKALILVEGPARDKGTAFLKIDKEIWNWVPSIEKVVKLPPSMMLQSWMGSDFTNDDLVRNSSIIQDYTHSILGEEKVDGYDCYKIELMPKPDAPVVWGKIVSWISKDSYLQLKSEFYDEDDYLINLMKGENVKEVDGRTIPTKLTITPVDDEGNQTIVEYISIDFDAEIDPNMFSVQKMKRLR